jgi:alkyl hydroperoxide reductase subunit F
MLDSATLEQLQSVFSRLDDAVILKAAASSHADQAELLETLREIESTSPQIALEENFGTSPAPRFEIHRSTGPTGMAFRGIPGGHEFSSLILSILYANGKGKQPDEGILQRIRNLKGPIRLKTYMSLSCENCPEVVQALHLMASHHDDFQHEVVDGAVAQDEIQALGIQGVPAVIHDGKLLHSGKSTLFDLLSKLEDAFGTTRAANAAPTSLGNYDVVVIGGGPAGASAAIYTVRKGLSTALVAERFGGQLQDTKGIENMISMPYTEGVKLAAQLAEHLGKYPVKTFEHRRVASIAGDEIKRITLESGEFIDAGAVIIATGAKWRELGIPGEKEHIGQGVAFCAHCDGPFYKGRSVAVVGGGNSGVEAAIDLAGIASHVTLLEYNDQLKADGVLVEKLKSLPNAVILTQAKSSRVIGDGSKVTGLEYHDRASGETRQVEVDGVFVQIGLLPNTQFLKGVLELTPYGEIVVDAKGRTSVPGIYAAGDVTTMPFKQIVTAMGDGAKVALTAFEDRLHGANRPGAGAARPAS